MRIPLTVMIIAIAMLASPHAYGQGANPVRKERAESRPGRLLAVAIVLIRPTQPALAPPSDSLVISPAAATPTPIMCRLRSGQKNRHGIA